MRASLIRSSIKRLEYQLHENMLAGEKDPDIAKKMNKLRDEMKQIQIQLIEVPIDENTNMTEEQLNDYFNSNKVNNKYKLEKQVRKCGSVRVENCYTLTLSHSHTCLFVSQYLQHTLRRLLFGIEPVDQLSRFYHSSSITCLGEGIRQCLIPP